MYMHIFILGIFSVDKVFSVPTQPGRPKLFPPSPLIFIALFLPSQFIPICRLTEFDSTPKYGNPSNDIPLHVQFCIWCVNKTLRYLFPSVDRPNQRGEKYCLGSKIIHKYKLRKIIPDIWNRILFAIVGVFFFISTITKYKAIYNKIKKNSFLKHPLFNLF